MKTFTQLREELNESSKAKFIAVAQKQADPDGWTMDGGQSVKDIVGLARKQHGDKFASDVEGVFHKSHFSRPNHTYGIDPLSYRPKPRVTKAGKVHKSDIEQHKNWIKDHK